MAYVEIEIDLYLFGQIQTSQTGGQVYRETSPNKVWLQRCHSHIILHARSFTYGPLILPWLDGFGEAVVGENCRQSISELKNSKTKLLKRLLFNGTTESILKLLHHLSGIVGVVVSDHVPRKQGRGFESCHSRSRCHKQISAWHS